MSDYDAIVVGAGHNGLTAAAVMARGGMRVLCLEKNHFIGGMASTTELVRGYRFELAGSIQFPVPNEIFEDLGFARARSTSPTCSRPASVTSGEPPILLYSDPERLLEHLGELLGIDAVLGMAEVAAWAEAPARAIGRFDVRKPPKSLDEMWSCALEREGAPGDPHRDVRQRHGRRGPASSPTGKARPDPEHAELPRRQLHLPRPVHTRECALSRLCARLTRETRPCRRCEAASARCPTTCSDIFEHTGASSAAMSRSRRSSTGGHGVKGVELGRR